MIDDSPQRCALVVQSLFIECKCLHAEKERLEARLLSRGEYNWADVPSPAIKVIVIATLMGSPVAHMSGTEPGKQGSMSSIG